MADSVFSIAQNKYNIYMNRDYIRNKLIVTLKQIIKGNPNSITQMNSLVDSIRTLIPKDTPEHLHAEYHKHVFEIVHEWYRAGILYFGKFNDANAGYPWITLTDFGKECIKSGNFLPYDPEGYVRDLITQVPTLDGLTITYLSESISTYNSEHLLSSAITLGVASENIILRLIEVFIVAMNDLQEKTRFSQRIANKSIYSKYSLFTTELKRYYRVLPNTLIKDLEVQLDGVFNFIRTTRNQAGHPTGQSPTKKVIGSNLQIFAEYSKRVFDLIAYFETHTI